MRRLIAEADPNNLTLIEFKFKVIFIFSSNIKNKCDIKGHVNAMQSLKAVSVDIRQYIV